MEVRFVCGKKSLRRESRSCAHHIVCARAKAGCKGVVQRERKEARRRGEQKVASTHAPKFGKHLADRRRSFPPLLIAPEKLSVARYENVGPIQSRRSRCAWPLRMFVHRMHTRRTVTRLSCREAFVRRPVVTYDHHRIQLEQDTPRLAPMIAATFRPAKIYPACRWKEGHVKKGRKTEETSRFFVRVFYESLRALRRIFAEAQFSSDILPCYYAGLVYRVRKRANTTPFSTSAGCVVCVCGIPYE